MPADRTIQGSRVINGESQGDGQGDLRSTTLTGGEVMDDEARARDGTRAGAAKQGRPTDRRARCGQVHRVGAGHVGLSFRCERSTGIGHNIALESQAPSSAEASEGGRGRRWTACRSASVSSCRALGAGPDAMLSGVVFAGGLPVVPIASSRSGASAERPRARAPQAAEAPQVPRRAAQEFDEGERGRSRPSADPLKERRQGWATISGGRVKDGVAVRVRAHDTRCEERRRDRFLRLFGLQKAPFLEGERTDPQDVDDCSAVA